MGAYEFSIRSTDDSDWREIRDVRLEMIRDTPTGYAESLEEALRHEEAEWRMRGHRGASDQGIAIAAITESGRWVGTMAGFVPDPETGPLLVGVYVAPDYRGSKVGLTDALLTAVEDWARTESHQLTLHVHEDNVRARKAYENRGFAATGHSVPYNLDPSRNELEMVKKL
ncbi:GNAT family N-acetyltransferase [Cryobacterium sp. TMT2-15-1]|uniref:GNAT family N-acetyltransferase n=1 Tax=Cryobacterium sp. TMT2-15-1 TaxID=1259246 RepID=UPI00106C2D33|nr:GNAT family N-acetyltransferase [Cryobacterium sp. TMT2-15-1]TFC58558.1 GNAT family N-acetyltransferase [Cryobacterium sp. TMT2-15-1]